MGSHRKNSKIRNLKPPTLGAGRDQAQNQPYGTIYVVSTPIGNLEDITLRALRVLESVDLIAAENMTRTKGLCGHYGIKTRLTSYNQHNQKVKAPKLISRIKCGQDLAVVTDAGTPGISDPGVYLVNLAANENIKATPIPGPSAVIAALSVSGLPTQGFLFLGFLPNKIGKRKKLIASMAAEVRTMVLFEAPHRISTTLSDLSEVLGDRHIVMLREMTKVYEEIQRGPAKTLLRHMTKENTKGEFTLVIAGRGAKEKPQAISETVTIRIEGLLAENKMSVKDIADLLSTEEGLTYRQIYNECLARKRVIERSESNGASKSA